MKNRNLNPKEYLNAGYKDFKLFVISISYSICKMIYKHFPKTINKTVSEIVYFPDRFVYNFRKFGYEIIVTYKLPFIIIHSFKSTKEQRVEFIKAVINPL